MKKIIITGIPEIHTEDSGCAIIAEVSEEERDIFVRIQEFYGGFKGVRYIQYLFRRAGNVKK